MREGSIVEYGPCDQIIAQPQHPYTRKLLSSFPSLTGERGDFLRSPEPEATTPGGAR
jgi:oligopeptide/dipeptide ABC transporter ATP-binding protein